MLPRSRKPRKRRISILNQINSVPFVAIFNVVWAFFFVGTSFEIHTIPIFKNHFNLHVTVFKNHSKCLIKNFTLSKKVRYFKIMRVFQNCTLHLKYKLLQNCTLLQKCTFLKLYIFQRCTFFSKV